MTSTMRSSTLDVVRASFLLVLATCSAAMLLTESTLADGRSQLDPGTHETIQAMDPYFSDDDTTIYTTAGWDHQEADGSTGIKDFRQWVANMVAPIKALSIASDVTDEDTDGGSTSDAQINITVVPIVTVLPHARNKNKIYVETTKGVQSTLQATRSGNSGCMDDRARDISDEMCSDGHVIVHGQTISAADTKAFTNVEILVYFTLPPTVFVMLIVLIIVTCMKRKERIGYEAQLMIEEAV